MKHYFQEETFLAKEGTVVVDTKDIIIGMTIAQE